MSKLGVLYKYNIIVYKLIENSRNMSKHCFARKSLRTYSAREFPSVHVWRAWQWSANALHCVKQCSIVICLTPGQPFWLLVKTHEIFDVVGWMFSYQVPTIFKSPSRRTGSLGWNHELSWSIWYKTHDTECIQVIQWSPAIVCPWKYGFEMSKLILCSINFATRLQAVYFISPIRIMWKTQIIGAPSFFSIQVSTNVSYNTSQFTK